MNSHDPLDWTHQWEHFEMMMYALSEGEETGIFMQVTERIMRDGAEEWDILYDRRIADLGDDVVTAASSEHWEEQVLRRYLNAHPDLVSAEKAYLSKWVESREM